MLSRTIGQRLRFQPVHNPFFDPPREEEIPARCMVAVVERREVGIDTERTSGEVLSEGVALWILGDRALHCRKCLNVI